MPFSEIEVGEVAVKADDEAAMQAEMDDIEKQEQHGKIQAAFDGAAFELENMADKDMDFNDFIS